MYSHMYKQRSNTLTVCFLRLTVVSRPWVKILVFTGPRACGLRYPEAALPIMRPTLAPTLQATLLDAPLSIFHSCFWLQQLWWYWERQTVCCLHLTDMHKERRHTEGDSWCLWSSFQAQKSPECTAVKEKVQNRRARDPFQLLFYCSPCSQK